MPYSRKNESDALAASRAKAAAKAAALGPQSAPFVVQLDANQTAEAETIRAQKMAEAAQGHFLEPQIASMRSAHRLTHPQDPTGDLDSARKRANQRQANLGTPAAWKPASDEK